MITGVPGSFTREDLIAAARTSPRPEVGDDEIRLTLKRDILPLECWDYRVLDEFGIAGGAARVDVAAIGATELVGYEIKSELDSLRRLERQQSLYSAVFDRVTLVVAPNHLEHAISRVPEWWGIIEIGRENETRIALHRLREATPNPSPDLVSTLALLWRIELVEIARSRAIRVGSMRKAEIIERVSATGDSTRLRNELRALLLHRTLWQSRLQQT